MSSFSHEQWVHFLLRRQKTLLPVCVSFISLLSRVHEHPCHLYDLSLSDI